MGEVPQWIKDARVAKARRKRAMKAVADVPRGDPTKIRRRTKALRRIGTGRVRGHGRQ